MVTGGDIMSLQVIHKHITVLLNFINRIKSGGKDWVLEWYTVGNYSHCDLKESYMFLKSYQILLSIEEVEFNNHPVDLVDMIVWTFQAFIKDVPELGIIEFFINELKEEGATQCL